MKEYIKLDEWKIIEEGLVPSNNRISESIFSIGNGFMGQRANFEEYYSGETLQGTYIGGVYYPDKTRVGWWKNGYPEYFAKIINATNWIGINVAVEGELFDLNHCEVEEFTRELNMHDGVLSRKAIATLPNGKKIKLTSRRFVSLIEKDLGAIEFTVVPMNFSGSIELIPYLNGDVVNSDSNYDEKFWIEIGKKAGQEFSYVHNKTKKTGFDVCTAMKWQLSVNGNSVECEFTLHEDISYVANKLIVEAKQNEPITLNKYVTVESSLYYNSEELVTVAEKRLNELFSKGFNRLLDEHSQTWHKKWEESDIRIGGDLSAQQAIRFNIFQLYQTYTGENENLNIGPKGFTGEKYGGVTYWDTEAYCLPFYMRTADAHVARNLLKYRYNHLKKAQENAQILGFNHGAALYPMVTINGEECHNEWEITFEEIHRNGAIAYAIYNYIQYTGDELYMAEYGLEVLIGISRFWSQRVNWSEAKQKYVLLGVTGPNEYENNVNNNWYTLKLINWTLNYTMEQVEKLSATGQFDQIAAKTKFDKGAELDKWKDVVDNLYFPEDKSRNIFLQQDGFLDKDLTPARELPASERPIHQNWSWDRILRSCYIKQADVLQGLYMFEKDYDEETIKRNFDFYEPLTVHESSLSPCIHSIIASKIGYHDKAYEMYLRTARLDLNDINNDTEDGLHITSMGGTWMSIVEGFAGLRMHDNTLSLAPSIPNQWEFYEFRIVFRGIKLDIRVEKGNVLINNLSDKEMRVRLHDEIHQIDPGSSASISTGMQEIIS